MTRDSSPWLAWKSTDFSTSTLPWPLLKLLTRPSAVSAMRPLI